MVVKNQSDSKILLLTQLTEVIIFLPFSADRDVILIGDLLLT